MTTDGSDALTCAIERFELGNVVRQPLRPVEAWSNEIYRVRTDRGDFAVKVFPSEFTRTSLSALRHGMAVEAAALATGAISMAEPLPAPRAGAKGTGEADGAEAGDPDTWLAEVETAGGLRYARCHRWLDGLPATGTRATAAAARNVGRSLGILHGLHLDGGDSGQLAPVDLERWQRAVSGAERAELPWYAALAALTPLVEELAGKMAELRAQRRPMRSSHGDLDPKNAVVGPDGRIGITDWDSAGPVLPGVELVVAATSFAGTPVDEKLVEEFVAAYREAGGDAEPPDRPAMVAETADLDWLLRNVEGCLPGSGTEEDVLPRRLAPQLIGSFAGDVAALEAWADRVG